MRMFDAGQLPVSPTAHHAELCPRFLLAACLLLLLVCGACFLAGAIMSRLNLGVAETERGVRRARTHPFFCGLGVFQKPSNRLNFSSTEICFWKSQKNKSRCLLFSCGLSSSEVCRHGEVHSRGGV